MKQLFLLIKNEKVNIVKEWEWYHFIIDGIETENSDMYVTIEWMNINYLEGKNYDLANDVQRYLSIVGEQFGGIPYRFKPVHQSSKHYSMSKKDFNSLLKHIREKYS